MNLAEIGAVLRDARISAGLTQAEVAAMVGVSRATLNSLENGRGDIGTQTLLSVAELLSVRISTEAKVRKPKTHSAIEAAAASASVSYTSVLTGKKLATALLTGTVDYRWVPHLSHFVDEQSNATVVRVVQTIAQDEHVDPKIIWQNARKIALELQSNNPRWKKTA